MLEQIFYPFLLKVYIISLFFKLLAKNVAFSPSSCKNEYQVQC